MTSINGIGLTQRLSGGMAFIGPFRSMIPVGVPAPWARCIPRTSLLICFLFLTSLFVTQGDNKSPSNRVSELLSDRIDEISQPYEDKTVESGLRFQHFQGTTGRFLLPEITGSGGGLIDFDRDGDLDLYLVQGDFLDSQNSRKDREMHHDRLFRNDLRDGILHWTDVTIEAGIPSGGYGMGVAVGDYNRDGWDDLYITNLGKNRLLKNLGNGQFEDVSGQAGVEDHEWGTSAVFLDFDRDGWLDLFVVNYVTFSLDLVRSCYAANSSPDFCGPSSYEPSQDLLYHNLGNGTFREITMSAGLGNARGPGLGVVTGDWNADGWTDIYVANDGARNRLWLNQRGQGFKDAGLLSGSALNGLGHPEAGMGVDSGDFDHDGDEDLFLAHLMGESNTLYVNDGSALFEDRTTSFDLHAPSLNRTSFGAGFLDFDNDGWLDLFVANGGVKTMGQDYSDDHNPMVQPNQLFRNVLGKQFLPMQALGGKGMGGAQSSRGALLGDLDNDGDQDIVISNNGGSAQLLLNRVGQRNHWLGVDLQDLSKHQVHGARIKVTSTAAGARSIHRWFRRGGSYCSSRDPRLLVGLGDMGADCEVTVYWADGEQETWPSLAPDRYWKLSRGASKDQK